MCCLCQFLTNEKSSYIHHMLCHRRFEENVCPVCDKNYADAKWLQRHVVNHSRGKLFSCVICVSDEEYQCCLCQYSTDDKFYYVRHMLCHRGKEKTECPVCHKSYAQVYTLQTHVMQHCGTALFTCAICGKGFTQKGNVKNHLQRIHGIDC